MRYMIRFAVVFILLSNSTLTSGDELCPLTPRLIEENLESLRKVALSSGDFESRHIRFLDRLVEEVFTSDEFKDLRPKGPGDINIIAKSDGTVVSSNLTEWTERRRLMKSKAPKCSFFFIRVSLDHFPDNGATKTIVSAIERCTEYIGAMYHDRREVNLSKICN